MKNMSRHTTERAPFSATQNMLRVIFGIPLHLVTKRSLLQNGFWTALVCFMFAGPAGWRWRKYALFPHGVHKMNAPGTCKCLFSGTGMPSNELYN